MNKDDNIKEGLLQIFYNIKNISPQEINDFFQKNIKTTNISQEINNIPQYPPTNPDIKPPYINAKLTKKFSLVLDLDETLISLDRNKVNQNNKGILKFRPGLLKFLSKIKKFYEIIVFTSGTKEYADQIIDVIENDEKFFDFRLYREHTLFYNNEFIKDISRIGRPLDKIIIVDNLPQNFRLQKENGIEIKSFFGDDNNDKALVSLGNILKKIANRFNDTRNGIIEYKNEIKNKIS
jgi:CTD small phosphatase-like protein 2